ncbi:recombinase family protein [Roseomonas sp. PWR1]|uniref:Recombinase family protein n=1 Tax=Roseomonas nitratireducens TaxID=2820810 RepID=A0ABS4AWY6_9PROT|nr:recombinase family protein [Neoroseomonas nitratireducens]MBP0465861.1 recombinase family protein [Neoroseomonas nitratireducens]
MDIAVPRTFIAYARVSTERQGRSGLGLDAQEAAIRAFLRPGDRLLTPTFVEVESGRRNDRPELAKALAKCRATGATLLVAKLDRLARNARFLLSVVEGTGDAGVVFLDLPTIPPGPVGKFLLTQMAAVAELEAGLIGQRTRAALAAAKARGQTLGGLRPGQRLPDTQAAQRGAAASQEARQRKADHAAHRVLSRIEALRAEGASLASVAAALSAEGVPTPRGGSAWTATAVRRAMLRASVASVEG